jgi:tRNA1(Val) A37 N6-methylase TrmN6
MNPLRSIEKRVHIGPNECVDEFLDAHLKLIQSKTGYRFSIDALLLAEFVTIRKDDIVLDLGTGCGIIPLWILKQKAIKYAIGLEIQEQLADQAARNIVLNGFSPKMAIVRGDIRYSPLRPMSVSVLICNPPYRQKNDGRINPDPQRAVARHEILATLNDILETARGVLKPKGRLALIYPAERMADMMIRLRGFEFEPKRMRLVYPNLNTEAKLALIEATMGGRPGLKVLSPIIDQGDYSFEHSKKSAENLTSLT